MVRLEEASANTLPPVYGFQADNWPLARASPLPPVAGEFGWGVLSAAGSASAPLLVYFYQSLHCLSWLPTKRILSLHHTMAISLPLLCFSISLTHSFSCAMFHHQVFFLIL